MVSTYIRERGQYRHVGDASTKLKAMNTIIRAHRETATITLHPGPIIRVDVADGSRRVGEYIIVAHRV